jgi:hypothetical protein
MLRRTAEEQLLAQGRIWIAALDSYAGGTPAGQSPLPKNLNDLLRDERQGSVKRHLRRIPIDPITNTREWGVIRADDGSAGISAVYSLSTAQPIKIQGFERRFDYFEDRKSYQDWKFMGPIR